MAQADHSKPGFKVKKLVCVTANNRNKYYNMFEQPNGTFIGCYGRVDGPETEVSYSMSKWDSTYKSKTQRKDEPYTDKTDLYITESKIITPGKVKIEMFGPGRDTSTVGFIKDLMSHANASVVENYDVNVTAVTKQQVAAAQAILDKLSAMAKPGQRLDDFNQTLIDLYMTIPRKMKNVKHHIFGEDDKITTTLLSRNGSPGRSKDDKSTSQGINQLLSFEQDTLDVMAGQVNTNVAETQEEQSGKNYDILTTLGLNCELVTSAAEIAMIKKKMDFNANGRTGDEQSHRFLRAFRVNNNSSENAFDKYIKDQNNKSKQLLWHGSRNENWWSIFQQSLKIRPTNAIITGKMWGYGIYFADKAKKSIGYTSGGYYAGGRNNSKGYLALFDMHQGDAYSIKRHQSEHSSLDWNRLQKYGTYDSVFALGGADLINNEYIIYKEQQCTIRYIVEFKA